MMVKAKNLLRVLEDAAIKNGLLIRRDKGDFKGGLCVVEGKTVVILNRKHPIEMQLSVLASALQGVSMDNIPMRPAMREAIRKLMHKAVAGPA